MMHQNPCRFCEIHRGEYKFSGVDEPFAACDDYIAFASIGALIEGWTLVVPKHHKLSMKDCYSRSTLGAFINTLLPHLYQENGQVIAFEHGANIEGSITSCGTDHAHLHLVPFADSLIPSLHRSGLKWEKCQASEINLLTGGNEYLFYCELGINDSWQDPVGLLHILEKPFSQFFRRLIAEKTSGQEFYDYKLNPNLNISMKTRKILSGLVV